MSQKKKTYIFRTHDEFAILLYSALQKTDKEIGNPELKFEINKFHFEFFPSFRYLIILNY